VLAESLVLRNPLLRQAPKRYMICFYKCVPKNKIQNNKKDETQNSHRKIYSFFQPLFCQRTSAHLQKANPFPTLILQKS